MGIPVLVMGETGSGKTYSLKNFNPDEIGIFSVEKGRMPFKSSGFKIAKHANYDMINKAFKKPALKTYVIDDSQYLLVHDKFAKAKDAGYQKFTDMAVSFYNLIQTINHSLPDDVIVYFLHHTQETETGKIKAKTLGKMIDNDLTLEGCFDVVLLTVVDGNNHFFVTQSDGYTTAKSPEGMFADLKIPNDLKAVDTAIREYWGL